MVRRKRSSLAAVMMLSFVLVGPAAPPVSAAVTCTTSSPGYQAYAKNVYFTPVPRPAWENNGHLGMVNCTDGAGISVQWKGWAKNYDTEGRPVSLSSIKLHTDSGDNCGTWDNYTVTYFNVSSNTHTTGWHWQPLVACGFAPRYNSNNHASGTMTLTNVYVWDWSINWP